MHWNVAFTSRTFSHEYKRYEFLHGSPDHKATGAYALFIFITVVNIVTCPFTIILNVLVMIAVKTKAFLKTNWS